MLKKVFTVCCAALLVLSITGCKSKKTDNADSTVDDKVSFSYSTEYDGKYYTLRNGFHNVYNKLESGKDITIAFMGGSITYGIGTDNLDDSFRILVENRLEKQYGVNVTGINAAIPSACSALGAYSVSSDVLAYKPDLVFVEYAINDKYALTRYTNEDFLENMETIVRKIRTENKNCDIAFLYTTAADVSVSTPLFEQAEIHERIAEHYGVCSINIGYGLRKGNGLIKSSGNDAAAVRWNQFFADGCHTNKNGNKVYADIITECLESGFNAAKAGVPVKGDMPKQLNEKLPDNITYVKAKDVPPDGSTGWKMSSDSWSPQNKGYIYTDSKDNELVYTFSGSSFGILGPTDREYSYSVDGGEWKIFEKFNSHPQPIVKGLNDGKHIIRIKVDDAEKSPFQIAAFLIG